MENFQSFMLVKHLIRTGNSKIMLVKSLEKSSNIPKLYIVKSVPSDRASQEAEIHIELSYLNPSILKYYHGWQKDDTYNHCIEYCEQGDLHNLFNCLKRLSFKQVLYFCTQVSNTVKILHDKKICHRDIKAMNIFVTKDWVLKLGDFGSSKRVFENERHSIVGTASYLSPELKQMYYLTGNEKNDPYRDDIWALGKVFLEIYSGNSLSCLKEYDQIHKKIDEDLSRAGSIAKFGELLKEIMCKKKSESVCIEYVLKQLRDIDKLRAFEDNDLKDLDLKFYFKCLNGGVPKGEFMRQENDYSMLSIEDQKEENEFFESVSESSICSFSLVERGNEYYNAENGTSITPYCTVEQENELNNALINSSILANSNTGSGLSNSTYRSKSSEDRLILNFEFSRNNEAPPIFSDDIEKSINEIPILNNDLQATAKRKLLKISSIKSLNIVPPLRNPPQRPMNSELETCKICLLSVTNEKVTIECRHSFHINCFKKLFELALIKAENKIDNFKCTLCSNPIPFEFFYDLKLLGQNARKSSYIQMLAHTNTNCPICKVTTQEFLLNEKLEKFYVTCKNCKTKFCSYCNKVGTHFYSCGEYKMKKKELKKISDLY